MSYIKKFLNDNLKMRMITRRSLFVFISLFLISFFLFLTPLAAQEGIGQLGLEYGTATGLGTQDIRLTVAKIIRGFLGALGIIAVVLIIYGGYLWMTAAGNEEKIEKAKSVLINASIGLAIILSAFAIVQFVISRLVSATFGLGEGERARGVSAISALSNSLGAGIIREHYPARDAIAIPRNVKIIVTFKEPISIPSLIKNYDDKNTPADVSDDLVRKNDNNTPGAEDDFFELNSEALKIYPSEGGRGDALEDGQVKVNFTSDLQTWIFDPASLLGSPSEDVSYTVEFAGGAKSARLHDGEPAFSGVYSSGYSWEFQVSTFIDTTPPKISSVLPRENVECAAGAGGKCARNVIITINFDEPVDPTSVSGLAPTFTNIVVDSNGADQGGEVAGNFAVSNQYKTVEFTPSVRCGTNSCGGEVFCLPSANAILVTLRAAKLSNEPPGAALPYPFDGVTDAVGNSLDGNGNGRAEGPGADNFSWSFPTSSIIDLSPPQILNTEPAPNSANINVEAPMKIVFSETMRQSSISNETIHFRGARAPEFLFDPAVTPWYATWSDAIYWPNRTPVTGSSQAPTGNFATTETEIRHGALMVDSSYYPEVTSGVQDLYQNCFYPSNQSTGPLQCATSPAKPFCCFGQVGAVSCGAPCALSQSGNPVCQE